MVAARIDAERHGMELWCDLCNASERHLQNLEHTERAEHYEIWENILNPYYPCILDTSGAPCFSCHEWTYCSWASWKEHLESEEHNEIVMAKNYNPLVWLNAPHVLYVLDS